MPAGRPRKPTKLKLLDGTYRPDKDRKRGRVAELEPEPPEGRPRKPRELDAIAAKEWEFVCEKLERMNLLNQADRALIEVYARTYSQWRRLCRTVEAEGLTQIDRFGNPRRHPAHSAAMQCVGAMDKLLRALGLTPEGRSHLAVERQQVQGVRSRRRG